eukprot:4941284-Amphidinium_carterae.1
MTKTEPCSFLPGSLSRKVSITGCFLVQLAKACQVIRLPGAYTAGLSKVFKPRNTGPAILLTWAGMQL